MKKVSVTLSAIAVAVALSIVITWPVSAVTFSGLVSRVLPSGVSDGAGKATRLSRYGELYSIPITSGRYGMADEGSYWHATTATPGTAFTLTQAAQTAFSATVSAVFTVKNNDSESAKRLYIDFVKIAPITAGTAGTRVEFAVTIDNTTRYSSGGTALTAYNVNMDIGTSSISSNVFAGAITSSAASGSVRYQCRGILKTAIPAVGDQYMVRFGSDDLATGIVGTTHPPIGACPPAVLGGGDTFLLHIWLPSQSAAPTGEVSAAWWER